MSDFTKKICFGEMHKCTEESPKKDGYYVVVKVNEDGHIYHVYYPHFTQKYGWNTHIDSTEHRIPAEDNAYWCECFIGAEDTEVKQNE